MKERYYSLDVFRGATVAFMILVNNPGSWGNIFAPLEHATWHGCTPTDLVFPFFLFAVGNAMAFVMPRLRQQGTTAFLKKVIRRTVLIFVIGLFLNWSPFIQWKDAALVAKHWENIRILGVLQRIALCYFFASLIVFFCKTRTVIIISALILLGYWLLCYLLGSNADPYSLSGYFGTAVDKTVLGPNHMYKGEGLDFDPEGLASTMAAIVQPVMGYFVGRYIRQKGKTWEMLSHLFIAGVILVFVGFCWDMTFPINKKIWTSSFVLYSAGLATMVLAFFIYLVEFRNERGRWSSFFNAFGKNPLFIFFLSGFLPRIFALVRWVDHLDNQGKPVYVSILPWFYLHICKPISDNLKIGSLVYAICIVAFYWSIAYMLEKKKIFIKV
jgi:predicted acyltransferase